MRFQIVTPTYPPVLCGIGDHSSRLAHQLALADQVDVLSGCGNGQSSNRVPVSNVFDRERPNTFASITDAVLRDPPDWLVWQYDPFSFGRSFGINPRLLWEMARIRAAGIRQAVVVHEISLSSTSVKRAALWGVLGAQLGLVCSFVNIVFVTVEQWATKIKRWFPFKVVRHLPVGSNLPRVAITREEARHSLGLDNDTLVLGYFGRLDLSRGLEHVRRTVSLLVEAGRQPLLLYFGLSTQTALKAFAGLPVRADGPLSAEAASVRMSALDVYLGTYSEGLTSRRTAVMAALQHGVPTVATVGPRTEQVFRKVNGTGLLLAPASDPKCFAEMVVELSSRQRSDRLAFGTAGQTLFEANFSWPAVAARFRAGLVSGSS